MIRSLRILVLSGFALALASCSGGAGGLLGGLGGLGGGNGGIFNSGASCNPGTDVQLANPLPFQSNVNPNIGQITIVANGNNNYLGQNYQTMNITLFDGFGNQYPGGTLQPVSDPNGPHPYTSDFYYQSSIGPLQTGATYTAEITLANVSTFNSCSYTLQSFRT
jgi:hypothetical protein